MSVAIAMSSAGPQSSVDEEALNLPNTLLVHDVPASAAGNYPPCQVHETRAHLPVRAARSPSRRGCREIHGDRCAGPDTDTGPGMRSTRETSRAPMGPSDLSSPMISGGAGPAGRCEGPRARRRRLARRDRHPSLPVAQHVPRLPLGSALHGYRADAQPLGREEHRREPVVFSSLRCGFAAQPLAPAARRWPNDAPSAT